MKENFESYLKDNFEKQIIDYCLRVHVNAAGTVNFYIRPDSKDGQTLDLTIAGNQFVADSCPWGISSGS